MSESGCGVGRGWRVHSQAQVFDCEEGSREVDALLRKPKLGCRWRGDEGSWSRAGLKRSFNNPKWCPAAKVRTHKKYSSVIATWWSGGLRLFDVTINAALKRRRRGAKALPIAIAVVGHSCTMWRWRVRRQNYSSRIVICSEHSGQILG